MKIIIYKDHGSVSHLYWLLYAYQSSLGTWKYLTQLYNEIAWISTLISLRERDRRPLLTGAAATTKELKQTGSSIDLMKEANPGA